MALYAIGSLGSEEKSNDELKVEIGGQLAEHLLNTNDSAEQVATLNAIGNYGGAELIGDISPFLSDPQADLRVAAYNSLRRIDDPDAVDLLIQSYYDEPSAKVQKIALQTLTTMPVTEQSIKFVRTEAGKSDSPALQKPLVKILGDNLPQYPENEKFLRMLLKEETGIEIKKEIYHYIRPTRPAVNVND